MLGLPLGSAARPWEGLCTRRLYLMENGALTWAPLPRPWGGQGEGSGAGRPGCGGEGADEADSMGHRTDGQGVLSVPPWWRSLEDVGVSLLGGQALRPGACLHSEGNAAATERPFSGLLRGGFPSPGGGEGQAWQRPGPAWAPGALLLPGSWCRAGARALPLTALRSHR